MTPDTSSGPFDGVRVLELAQWVFVPVAGALLADWGADVVRIEHPTDGDAYRGLAAQGLLSDAGGVNLSMELANRGKRGVAIDIRTPRGMELVHELLAESDVLLTNFRPGTLRRLGLDPAELRRRHPRLVVARGHGYGVRGPDADRPGYDASAFWARGGAAHVLTPDVLEYPIGQRGAIGDRNGGLALAFGIASALLKRERTGAGSIVDVSLLGMAVWMFSSDVLAALQGERPRARWDRHALPNPLVNMYRTSDGRHIQLVLLQPDRYWPDLCRTMGREDLACDPRFADMEARNAHRAECVAILDEEFAKRTYREWCELLAPLDAPWSPVQSIEELLVDVQVVANDYIAKVDDERGLDYSLPTVPVQLDERPPRLRRGPEHGEHTDAVLAELGYGWDEIVDLKVAGVIL